MTVICLFARLFLTLRLEIIDVITAAFLPLSITERSRWCVHWCPTDMANTFLFCCISAHLVDVRVYWCDVKRCKRERKRERERRTRRNSVRRVTVKLCITFLSLLLLHFISPVRELSSFSDDLPTVVSTSTCSFVRWFEYTWESVSSVAHWPWTKTSSHRYPFAFFCVEACLCTTAKRDSFYDDLPELSNKVHDQQSLDSYGCMRTGSVLLLFLLFISILLSQSPIDDNTGEIGK